jgi:hypothetical protein
VRRIGTLFQGLPKRLRRARSVGVLRLPLVAELGDGPVLPVRHEDRVEAEALRAPRLVGDAALEDSGSSELFAGRREGDELADVAGSAPLVFDPLELPQEPLDVLAAREARRLHARGAAETVDLQP